MTVTVKLLVTDFTLMSTSACSLNFTSGHHLSSVSHLPDDMAWSYDTLLSSIHLLPDAAALSSLATAEVEVVCCGL